MKAASVHNWCHRHWKPSFEKTPRQYFSCSAKRGVVLTLQTQSLSTYSCTAYR
jgi:hypothetical protein